MLKTLTPNVMVEDVKATIDFYRQVLGFEPISEVPPNADVLDWAMIKRDDVALMLQARASLAGELPALKDVPIGGSMTFYIQMEGVEALYNEIKGKVEIVRDMHTTFYGAREFAIRDNNGYILAFAQGS